MCMTGAILGSAALGAFSSSKAASAQTQAAERQAEVQERIYDENVERFDPYYQGGLNAFNALQYELGLGPRPGGGGMGGAGGAGQPIVARQTQQPIDVPNNLPAWGASGADWRDFGFGMTEGGRRDDYYDQNGQLRTNTATQYAVGDQMFDSMDAAQAYVGQQGGAGDGGYQGFRATPGYGFRVQEGINALDAGAASQGGLFSGAAGKALTEFGQNIGSQEYGNYINRLTGMASSGQNAAGQQAAAGQNYATGMSNAYGAMGNAQAAGAIGMGNAATGAINNWMGYQQLNRLLG